MTCHHIREWTSDPVERYSVRDVSAPAQKALSTDAFYFRREDYMKVISPIISQPGFFNLTSTFRTDSNFPVPYLFTEPLPEPCGTCPPNASALQVELFIKSTVNWPQFENCSTETAFFKHLEIVPNLVQFSFVGNLYLE